MIRVTVLYPHHPGRSFDTAYYCDRHIPMVQRLLAPALRGVTVDCGLSGEAPGSAPPYFAMVHLSFDSIDAFESAFGPHEAAITRDIPRYTDVEPIVQISEVRVQA